MIFNYQMIIVILFLSYHINHFTIYLQMIMVILIYYFLLILVIWRRSFCLVLFRRIFIFVLSRCILCKDIYHGFRIIRIRGIRSSLFACCKSRSRKMHGISHYLASFSPNVNAHLIFWRPTNVLLGLKIMLGCHAISLMLLAFCRAGICKILLLHPQCP